jgi:toxin YoeB
MKKVWSDEACEEYLYWQTQDKKILKKINTLIKDTDRYGYHCQGKPEGLEGDLAGFWSIRIDECKYIVYRIVKGKLEIWQRGSHYRDK